MLKRRLPLVGQEWLDDHIENFIKPNLAGGVLPDIEKFGSRSESGRRTPTGTYIITAYDFGGIYLDNLRTMPDLFPAFLKTWEEIKKRAKGRVIFFPGRDTWMLEVLARLEGVKTIFRPDISSSTWKWVAKFDPQREEFKTCYAVDSGNVGSVPKGLGCLDFGLVYYSSHELFRQLLPHNGTGPNNEVYNVLEGMPKYWSRGILDNGNLPESPILATNKIIQKVGGDPAEGAYGFQIAAVGTILLANYWLKVNPVNLARRGNLKLALSIARRRRTTFRKVL